MTLILKWQTFIEECEAISQEWIQAFMDKISGDMEKLESEAMAVVVKGLEGLIDRLNAVDVPNTGRNEMQAIVNGVETEYTELVANYEATVGDECKPGDELLDRFFAAHGRVEKVAYAEVHALLSQSAAVVAQLRQHGINN